MAFAYDDAPLTSADLDRHPVGKPPKTITNGIAELEKFHGKRRGWVWAELDQAPLAFALKHLATLAELAALYMEEQNYGEALNLYQRALKANPLDRRLRAKVS